MSRNDTYDYDDDDDDQFDPYWREEEEDNQAIFGGPNREDRVRNRSRSRSPGRSVRSSVVVPDSAIERRVDRFLSGKLDNFLRQIQSSLPGPSPKEVVSDGAGGFEEKLEALQASQAELKRAQVAHKMRTDGGRYQYLALADVQGQIESLEKILASAISNGYSMPPSAILQLAQISQEAKSKLERRMELVQRADSMPNGFKILTAFQKRMEQNQSTNPEVEKVWNESAKAVEKAKTENTQRPHARRYPSHGNDRTRRGDSWVY